MICHAYHSLVAALLLTGLFLPAQEPNQGGSLDLSSSDPKVALARMQLPEGFEIQCFADERDFAIANPVAQAFDARGRLWVLCMPGYPQVDPAVGPPKDRLVILEDTDGDGRADRQTIFADGLHVPTGFELGDGGAYVAGQPDLLFLKDEDGDDRADRIERVLHGFGTEDSHHSISAFTWTPGGSLCFQEGTFHHTQVETPYGPVRLVDAGVFEYEPHSGRLKVMVSYPFANPWGHVFDRFGQNFIADASGGSNYFAAPLMGAIDYPKKRRGRPSFTDPKAHMRPTAGAEFLSSRAFPKEMQGDFLLTNCIGFRGVRQYRMEERGAGFFARKVQDLLSSDDPNFRPVHILCGPDGALYVADWWNPLIGHMQYSLRDPRRDQAHGRIWRITYRGQTIPAENPAGRSLEGQVALLASPEDRTRYRTRLALREQPADQVQEALTRWLAQPDHVIDKAPHLHLEALWVLQHHGRTDLERLQQLLAVKDHRIRAAAVRILRAFAMELDEAFGLYGECIKDSHPRVRLETIVALSDYSDVEAIAVALKALKFPMDADLDYALDELLRHHEPLWTAHLEAGYPLCPDIPLVAERLRARTPTKGLFGLPKSEALYLEVLKRADADSVLRERAVAELGAARGLTPAMQALALLREVDGGNPIRPGGLGLLAARAEDQGAQSALQDLCQKALLPAVRIEALAALWIRADFDPTAMAVPAERLEVLAGLGVALEGLDEEGRAQRRDLLLPYLSAQLQSTEEQGESGLAGARFVRIELPGDARTLALAEVEVLAAGNNLAKQRPARQSSTDEDGPAERAVDGDRSTFRKDPQTGEARLVLAHTEAEAPNPWWEVDLEAPQTIEEIAIFNREEPHLYQDLDGFTLKVLNAKREVIWQRLQLQAPKPGLLPLKLTLNAKIDAEALRLAALEAMALVAPDAAWPELAKSATRPKEEAKALALLASALPRLKAAPPGATELRTMELERLLGTPWHERLEERWLARTAFLRGLSEREGEEVFAQTDAAIQAAERPLRLGEIVYGQHCARCHREEGQGAPGAFPPLRNSPWIDLDDVRLTKLILHGLQGPLEIRGERYDAVMEPLGLLLNDEDIAAVLTYVRNRFGHRGPALREEVVTRIREATEGRNFPYRTDELLREHPLKKRPRIVFVTGDEEYRSEESMPMLAGILERDFGFVVHVAYAMNDEGAIDPNRLDHIEGLEPLQEADLMVLFTRFRALPEDELQPILDHVQAGKPVVGFRTATHAFRYPKEHPRAAALNEDWPARWLGQRWVSHHGHFGGDERRLTALTPLSIKHPILNGVTPVEIWSWLYHVDGDGVALNPLAKPLVMGRALESRASPSTPRDNPVAWTIEHPRSEGVLQRVYFQTAAHPYDFREGAIRRLALQGILWALGEEEKIPESGVDTTPREPYRPNPAGFGQRFKPDLKALYLAQSEGLIRPEPDGRVALPATTAELLGPKSAALETLGGGPPNLGFWTDQRTHVRWKLRHLKAPRYAVEVDFACPEDSQGAEIEIQCGDQKLLWKVPSTGAWNAFQRQVVGDLRGPILRPITLSFRPKTKPGAGVLNLRGLSLIPTEAR